MATRSTALILDGKRRATLPAQVVSDAGLDVGAHLIAQAVGPGRVLLMTRDEARADLIAQIRADAGVTGPTDTDSTADVRAMRREDQAAADTKAAAPEMTDPATSQARGRALLELLGLGE